MINPNEEIRCHSKTNSAISTKMALLLLFISISLDVPTLEAFHCHTSSISGPNSSSGKGNIKSSSGSSMKPIDNIVDKRCVSKV